MLFRRAVLLLLLLALVGGMLAPVAAQEKVLNIAFTQEPDTLLLPYSQMAFAGYVIGLYIEGAWDFDAELNPVPKLVAEIPSLENGGISEDGATITLRLREGLTWSDGDPLTSADFVFTYEMYTAETNAVASRYPYDEIASIEAPDDTTVVVTFNAPFAPWLGTLFTRIYPEHVLRPVFDAEGTLDNAEFAFAPSVASGPFMVEQWEIGSFIRLVRNPNYHGGSSVIDAVVVSFVPDDQAYLATFTSGGADIGTFFPFDQVPALEEAGLTVQLLPSGYNEGWFLNVSAETGHPALQDVNVRRAISLGFDELAITDDLLVGATFPPGSYWEGTPYARPDAAATEYDPEAAAALLDEAGWVDSNSDGTRDKDGVELVLRFASTTRQIRQDTGVVAQQQLAELGIGLELTAYPSDQFFAPFGEGGPVATGQYDIGQWSSTSNFPDPDTSRFLCSEIPSADNPAGGNWSGFCDPELDELFAQQRQTVNFDDRVALFHEIDQRLFDTYVWQGIWFDADLWAHSARVLNSAMNGATPFWNVVAWDLAS